MGDGAEPDYFKPGLPYLDGYEAHLILDIQTRATAVLTQKIHMNAPGSLPYLGFDLAVSIASQDDGIIHEGNQGGWATDVLRQRHQGSPG